MEKERKITKEELSKKVDFAKVEDKKKEEVQPEDGGFNLGKLLTDPAVVSLLKGGKDLFKKKEVDPNMCEITIKAPSEVVLKLFNVK